MDEQMPKLVGTFPILIYVAQTHALLVINSFRSRSDRGSFITLGGGALRASMEPWRFRLEGKEDIGIV